MSDRLHSEPTLPEVDMPSRRSADRHFALTVLYHPETDRIGQFTCLDELHDSGSESLSRLRPLFSGRDSSLPATSLADPYLSRAPVELHLSRRGLEVDPPPAGPSLKIDGRLSVESRLLGWPELERGVVISLSQRVVLLLHTTGDRSRDFADASLVGESDAIRRARWLIGRVAQTDTPVLLLGESGTGKELAAGAIHRHSRRSEKSLLSVNMAALPADLAAAELFGVRRGAFTGAERSRAGYFGQADGGTLFLDEIGACASAVQPQLLRALQSGEIQAMGGTPRLVDVRLIAATDAELADRGLAFSTALRHRLAGFEIHLPPLRERREDLGLLLRHFLPARVLAQAAEQPAQVSRWVEVVEKLALHDWPGNVRELANYCRQLTIASDDQRGLVLPDNLKAVLAGAVARDLPADQLEAPSDIRVREAMLAARWEVAQAARELQMSRQALYRRIQSIPELRVAADIPGVEVESIYHECQGDLEAAAMRLQVSRTALRRRWRAMDLVPGSC